MCNKNEKCIKNSYKKSLKDIDSYIKFETKVFD